MSLEMRIPVVEMAGNQPKGVVDYVTLEEAFGLPVFKDAVEAALEKPKTGNQALLESIRTQRREIRALSESLKSLREEHEPGEVLVRTPAEEDRLRSEVHQLRRKVKQFGQDKKHLRAENTALREENAELRENVDRYKRLYDARKAEASELREVLGDVAGTLQLHLKEETE